MDTMPHLSSSPPPRCKDDKGAASEEEEFHFGKCPAGVDGSEVSPTPNLEKRQSNITLNQPIEQSQPMPTVNLKPIGQAESEAIQSSLHMKNVLPEKYPCSDGHKNSVLNACSLTSETDFADFSVFGQQAAHAWCCGLGGTEFFGGNEGITSQSEHFVTSGQDVILDSEPKSSEYRTKEAICTKVNHCEKKSQDFVGKQYFLVEGEIEEKKLGKSAESHKERKHSFNLNFLRISKEAEETLREKKEKKEKSVSTLCQTASLYDFADSASCDEDSLQEEPSEDFEPNVSSLTSQENTDTEDQTDDEVELRNYRLSRSFCNDYIWYSLQASSSDGGVFYQDQSEAQESSTSGHSENETHTEDSLLRSVSFEADKGYEQVEIAEQEVHSFGNLPPSDSFADFCSAPSQEDGECLLFQDQQDKHDVFRQHSDVTSCQVLLCCHVQQLFQDSFPQLVSAEEIEGPVYGLDALLFLKDQSDNDEEEARHIGSQWVTPGLWWPFQDIHSGVGLQYQWAGSHTNRSLLQCLGVDTRNIVFIGIKKQPVVVPAIASHREMQEPVKDSLSAVHFPGHTTVTTHAP